MHTHPRTPESTPLSWKRSPLFGLILLALMLVLVLVLLSTLFSSPAAAQVTCPTADFEGRIRADTTISGEVYMTGDVTIRNKATLTIEPGTTIYICGEYDLIVGDITDGYDGHLIAEGTSTDPITFTAADPALKWGRILFNGAAVPIKFSSLRHVILEHGGGNNPLAERSAAIEIAASAGTDGTTPLIDEVTISDSGSYGIYARTRSTDDTPPALTNLTISGSARAPILLYAAAAGGLGGGHTLTGNGEDVIEIRAGTVLGGSVEYDQTWLNHAVPYKLVSDFGVVTIDGDNEPILTIEPGVTLLIGESSGFWVQQGALVAEGTASEPITFTRVDNSSPAWRNIRVTFEALPGATRLSHAVIEHTEDTSGAIYLSNTKASFDHLTLRENSGPGIRVRNSFVNVSDSTFTGNQIGVLFTVGSQGVLRGNTFLGNIDGGVVNDDSRGSCVDAIGNYWGSANGPRDTSAEPDDCGNAVSNPDGSEAVSDNVAYTPWLPGDGDELADASSIQPEEPWVIADGVQQNKLTVTVRDQQGTPLVGKQVQLATTLGTIIQPTAPTNANGVAIAAITSTDTGNAVITGRNVTDNQQLSAVGAVRFWQGYGDTGGLIDPTGAPYASPDLIVNGGPVQAGFPLSFSVPMQNTNAVPVEVRVVYSATGLNIGARFTQVDEVTRVLQPGESWNAPGDWTPTITQKTCIQARIEFTLLGDPDALALPQNSGTTTVQKNVASGASGGGSTPEDPEPEPEPEPEPDPPPEPEKCPPPPEDDDFQPELQDSESENMEEVVKHQKKQSVNWGYVVCRIRNLGDPPMRGYESVVEVPSYTFPLIEPGPNVTQAQADALNSLSEHSAQIRGLNDAIRITLDRMGGAAEAERWTDAARQLAAFREFTRQVVEELRSYADATDALLAATEDAGIADVRYIPDDYAAELAQLQSSGFDAETLAFYKAAGLSDAQIESTLEYTISLLNGRTFLPTSRYEIWRNQRDRARELADQLEEQYGVSAVKPAQSGNPVAIPVTPLTEQFEVGNPTDRTATVELLVRPVDLPVNWTYDLSATSITLEPDETASVTLTLRPRNNQMIEETEIQVAVEGFIGSENIGGILFEYRSPRYYATADEVPTDTSGSLFLPLIER